MSSSLSPNAKIVLLTSEAGSLTLRTEGEGGGMFGHHGSKAAGNMIGHLLGYDLKERGVPIAMIHVRIVLLTFPVILLGIRVEIGDRKRIPVPKLMGHSLGS
jgi:hypothetical protein